MSSLKFTIVLIIATIVIIDAQVFNWGWCPGVKPMADFDLKQYTGIWYESGRLTDNYKSTGTCQYIEITETNSVLNITQRQFDSATFKGVSLTGIGKYDDATKIMNVAYPTGPMNYIVLNTDYKTYSAMYSCVDSFFFHTEYAYTLSRNRLMFSNELDNAKNCLTSANVSMTTFKTTDQVLCVLFN